MQMKQNDLAWLTLAGAAAFLAIGIPYWLIPYNRLNLPDALVSPGLLVVFIAALLLRLYRIGSFWRVTKFVGTAIPGVVIVRILVEALRNPATHNLWPFEVIIAVLVSLAVTLPGCAAGLLLEKLLGRGQ